MAIISNSVLSMAAEKKEVLMIPSNTINAMSSINIVNTGTTSSVVTIFIADVDLPAEQHAIEWELPLESGQVLSRTCGAMAAGEKMFVLSTTSEVAVRATAIVETL